MKDSNHILIHGWMINKLKLKGNDLLIFAIIYGFSQDCLSKFEGSLSYLEKSSNASRNTVIKSIKKLVELGFLNKHNNIINGVKFCSYSQNEPVVQKLTKGSAETAPPPSAETAPNNTNIYNTNNNILHKRQSSCKPEIDFSKLLSYINQKTGRSFRVAPEAVKKKYKARLKEGYTNADIKSAIDNAVKNQSHRDNNFQYLTFEFFSRSTTLDKYSDTTEVKDSLNFTPPTKSKISKEEFIRNPYND